MAKEHLGSNEIFEQVMNCRKSGLTDQQWCIDNAIPQSTFYSWLKRLRNNACFEVPDSLAPAQRAVSTRKQDVVKINVLPEQLPARNCDFKPIHGEERRTTADITLTIQGISIDIRNSVDSQVLSDTLRLLRTFIC